MEKVIELINIGKKLKPTLSVLLGLDTKSSLARAVAATSPPLAQPPHLYSLQHSNHLKVTDDAVTEQSEVWAIRNLIGADNSVNMWYFSKISCENCLWETDGHCPVLDRRKKVDRSWETEDLTDEELELKAAETRQAEALAKLECRKELFEGSALEGVAVSIDEIESYIEDFVSATNRMEDHKLGNTNNERKTATLEIEGPVDRAVAELLKQIVVTPKVAKENQFKVTLQQKMVAIIKITELTTNPNTVCIAPLGWVEPTGKAAKCLYRVKGISLNETFESPDVVDVQLLKNKTTDVETFMVTLQLINQRNNAMHHYSLFFGAQAMRKFVVNSELNTPSALSWFQGWSPTAFVNRFGVDSSTVGEGWIVPSKNRSKRWNADYNRKFHEKQQAETQRQHQLNDMRIAILDGAAEAVQYLGEILFSGGWMRNLSKKENN